MNSDTLRIFVSCDSAALSVGAGHVARAIEVEADKHAINIKLVRTGTRGMLWLEPLVEVEVADGKRVCYGPVSATDVQSLFDADFLSGGDHPLFHGVTEDIPYLANQERLIFKRCGMESPLDMAAYMRLGGLSGLKKAQAMRPADITEAVKQSGLRGRGGAGFPAGIKWETVMKATAEQKYICCNADEGDSGTFADRMLMEGDPFLLLEGMIIAAYAVGASRGFIYLRSEYPHAIDTMKKAIGIMRGAGHLGDEAGFDIELRTGAGAYICGEETAMLESLEGRRGEVRAKPPIPALEGLFGAPTIVNNVLTLASVPFILSEGAAAYAAMGAGRSRGTQPFQLAGDIKRGGLVEKAFGVTLGALVNDFGGGTASGRPVRAVQLGGPLGAYVGVESFTQSMDYETLADAGAMLGHGGIVVFNDTVNMAAQARFAMKFCEVESCGKCTPCRVGSVRGKETIDKIMAGDGVSDDVDHNIALLEELCGLMAAGSLCAMGALTPMPVQSALRLFSEDFTGKKPAEAAE